MSGPNSSLPAFPDPLHDSVEGGGMTKLELVAAMILAATIAFEDTPPPVYAERRVQECRNLAAMLLDS